MKRRRWDSKTKTKIVLEGLSGRPISEICNEYGIHQNQFYLWRDKFHIWEKQIVERRTEKTADKDKDDYKTQKEDPIERRMRKLKERGNKREQEQDRGRSDRSR